MSKEEKIGPYGYYLIGHHCEYDYHDHVFEFFEMNSQEAELEERIAELMNKEYHPYREKDIKVIRGNKLSFMAEKEVVREVAVKF